MDVRRLNKRRVVVSAPYNTLAEVATRMRDHNVGSVLIVDEDADVFSAATKMAARGVRRLPVLDAENEVKGVVSFDDLVILFAEQLSKLSNTVHAEMAPQAFSRLGA